MMVISHERGRVWDARRYPTRPVCPACSRWATFGRGRRKGWPLPSVRGRPVSVRSVHIWRFAADDPHRRAGLAVSVALSVELVQGLLELSPRHHTELAEDLTRVIGDGALADEQLCRYFAVDGSSRGQPRNVAFLRREVAVGFDGSSAGVRRWREARWRRAQRIPPHPSG